MEIETGAKNGRQRAVGGGLPLGERFPDCGGARIPGPAGRLLREPPLHAVEKRLPLVPRAAGDHQLCGNAIERRVVDDRGGDHVGLALELPPRVAAGHDDPRGQVAEFAGDRLGEHGAGARGAIPPWPAPDECVVGPVASREMHMRDERRRHRGFRHLGTTGDNLEHTRRDERPERFAENRLQHAMQRMEFEENGAAMFEDLADRVGRRQPRDVARPKNNRHSTRHRPRLDLPRPRAIEGGHVAQVAAADGSSVAAKHHLIVETANARGQHVDLHVVLKPAVQSIAAAIGMAQTWRGGERGPGAALGIGQGLRREHQEPHCRQWTGGGLLREHRGRRRPRLRAAAAARLEHHLHGRSHLTPRNRDRRRRLCGLKRQRAALRGAPRRVASGPLCQAVHGGIACGRFSEERGWHRRLRGLHR